jgi:hypothetical protein
MCCRDSWLCHSVVSYIRCSTTACSVTLNPISSLVAHASKEESSECPTIRRAGAVAAPTAAAATTMPAAGGGGGPH